jgi:hypothetical protein
MKILLPALILVLFGGNAGAEKPTEFRPLFDGKTLEGWINVNTGPDTWSVQDGELVCSGKPIGVMRSAKQYENFILEI